MATTEEMNHKSIFDFKVGELVKTNWFGELIKMEVIGHDVETNQIQVKHIVANGSFYTTTDRLYRILQ